MESVKKVIRERQPELKARIVREGLKGKLPKQLVIYHQAFGHLASPDNRTRKEGHDVISGTMSQERFRLGMVFLEKLAELGYGPEFLWNLMPKHYYTVIDYLVVRGIAVGNLRKHIAAFKCLYGWVMLSGGLKKNSEILPERFHRQPTYAVRVPTWKDNGIDFQAVLARIPVTLAWIAAALRLIQAFGLRLSESLLIDLHLADGGLYLVIYTGSKGRRWRLVPIDAPWKRALVDELKQAFPPGQALIGPEHLISKSFALGRYHGFLRNELGITRRESGVVSHGLRAEHLCWLYRLLTGEDAPILGGGPVAPKRDRLARKILAFVSGHTRQHIARYYVGRVKRGWRGTRKEADLPLDIPPVLVFLMKHEKAILAKERPRIEAALEARRAARTEPSYASTHRRGRYRRKPHSLPRHPRGAR